MSQMTPYLLTKKVHRQKKVNMSIIKTQQLETHKTIEIPSK